MVKARTAQDYKRKSCAKRYGGTFLIVTEGTVTEPEYFTALKRALRLPAADVEICPSHYGTDPISVVKFAADTAKRQRDLARKSSVRVPYDEVWVVFDQEGPQNGRNWQGGLDSARAKGFQVVFSNPSFEFWLLLHHEFTTAQFVDSAAVESRLKAKDPIYGKHAGQTDFAGTYLPKTEAAITNARRVRADHENTGSSNPYTDADELVIRLNLADRDHNRICTIKDEWVPERLR